MALHLKLRPKTLPPLCSVRPFSSIPPPPADPNAESDTSASDAPPPPSSYSSYFSDIKERLKAPPSPPRRIPDNPPPPPPFESPNRAPAASSIEEIRKHLASFRLRSSGSAPAAAHRSSSSSPVSFQDLLKSNALGNAGGGGAAEKEKLSFDTIRESLRQFRSSSGQQKGGTRREPFQFNLKPFQDNLRSRTEKMDRGPSLLGKDLPESIFGKELREKQADEEETKKVRKTEFLKTYTHDELGEKLRKLRPEGAAKGEKTWFSLEELNERLAKLRELEEEADERMGGVVLRDLRESLMRIKDADTAKKINVHRMSIFESLTGKPTPTFMLKPPQEELLERFFHPDNMSSEEKMKLELKRVRDEFKMSESDCGSARVQVAQLTTKIKHLNTVLHKKDKHSRKGLLQMVERRKKLIKYLRRTDWDSYCLVLAKLGLRDIPEYKKRKYRT